ncbi:hypothetical protein ACHAXM_002097 [Skeletonema potamos]
MKKTQLTAYEAAGAQPPSDYSNSHTTKEEVASEDSNTTKNADAAVPPTATTAPSGLDFLFAASQVETNPKDADASDAEVPSNIITAVGKGTPGSSCDANEASSNELDAASSDPTAATNKNQAKTFPQVLQEILTTPEYQSIAHWLPDGLSFIIADKQRFSDEILPKYFREALFRSFVRKLNRWGFRRVKSRGKGGESSFAHNNFVREKPLLCLKMRCKSKPSYHKEVKVPSAKKNAQQHAADAITSHTNTDRIAVCVQAPHPSLSMAMAAGGMTTRRRALVPACLPTASTLPTFTAAAAAAAGPPTGSVAATIQERQYLASIPYEHQQRIFRERQMIMSIFQMRQLHQLQMDLQRLNEMSSHNETLYTRDMLHRNIYYCYGG